MPKYSFECACGVSFSRTLKMGEHKTLECPSCKGDAARVFEGFGFGFAVGSSAPSNTGVAKLDYPTADQAVGSSADQRWEAYHAREKVKVKVREVGGDRALIRQNGPGNTYVEYQAGGPDVVQKRKRMTKELTEVLKRPPQ